QIMTAIVSEDAIAFSKVPGVGKKTAQRITLELQDKIKSLGLGSGQDGINMQTAAASSEKQDAIDALISLGYSRSETMRAVLAVATEDMSVDQIIRQALKKL
ncbi:MAG: helix-hairpin-helix domain-containing protein, partial [Defluviitaleaceae bacterium]|nr:helix-hairpin-helix domain-containing protein [Defluviitaleaceae bacterium]